MTALAELSVWTDVDPAHEADFNAWYDREHMQERVAIPGFRWGRRYAALDAGRRRYLALYQTDGLGVFTSDVYRAAFSVQTDWSVASLSRMRNPSRRVSTVAHHVGAGTGSALMLIELGVGIPEGAGGVMESVRALAGVVSQRILLPDEALSTPLPAESSEGRVLSSYLLIEASSETAARQAGSDAVKALGLPPSQAACFALLWDLSRLDLEIA